MRATGEEAAKEARRRERERSRKSQRNRPRCDVCKNAPHFRLQPRSARVTFPPRSCISFFNERRNPCTRDCSRCCCSWCWWAWSAVRSRQRRAPVPVQPRPGCVDGGDVAPRRQRQVPPRDPPMRRTAWTRVELLVVVGIIGVLIGLLPPSRPRACRPDHRQTCISSGHADVSEQQRQRTGRALAVGGSGVPSTRGCSRTWKRRRRSAVHGYRLLPGRRATNTGRVPPGSRSTT